MQFRKQKKCSFDRLRSCNCYTFKVRSQYKQHFAVCYPKSQRHTFGNICCNGYQQIYVYQKENKKRSGDVKQCKKGVYLK